MKKLKLKAFVLATLAATSGSLGAASPQKHPPRIYEDPAADIDERVEDLLARMTLAEKIGQMTQVEKDIISSHIEDLSARGIGSVLSGGAQAPTPNTPEAWYEMVNGFQRQALQSRLHIPLLYGVDAVHGHGNVKNAVIFPHNIGLGASRDTELVRRIGRATAEEVAATGIRWNFSPVLAVAQDIRWGRIYESFSENPDLVARMGEAYITGLQNSKDASSLADPLSVLASAKHFAGDGGTRYGTSPKKLLDRGDTIADETAFRQMHITPYAPAIGAGAYNVMVSYSSWNGVKMHANSYLLTDVLKQEMGFNGFLVSDWMGIDDLGSTPRGNIKIAVGAGLDMIMVPTAYREFMANLEDLVLAEEIPMARIDDALRRILRVKFMLGLFEHPFTDRALLSKVGSAEHRALAREAVAKTLVLLKNENNALPIAPDAASILVAGEAADDIGTQCGGWTIAWQGSKGPITAGTTILSGIRAAVSPQTQVAYSKNGDDNGQRAQVGIAVVGEAPYAEWEGDTDTPELTAADKAVIRYVRTHANIAIVVLVSGRPLIVGDAISDMDGLIAAWLPGSEGNGVADVLFGQRPFSARLSFTWPRNLKAIAARAREGEDVLYPYGYKAAL